MNTNLFGEPLAQPKPRRCKARPKAECQLSLWDYLRELWPEKAAEWAESQGITVERLTATGHFRAGGKWFEIGNVENGYAVCPVASSQRLECAA